MKPKGNTEQQIIEALEKILAIMEKRSKEVKALIAKMESETKPFEEYLNALPKGEFEFYYGKSFKVRQLIDGIKEFTNN